MFLCCVVCIKNVDKTPNQQPCSPSDRTVICFIVEVELDIGISQKIDQVKLLIANAIINIHLNFLPFIYEWQEMQWLFYFTPTGRSLECSHHQQ